MLIVPHYCLPISCVGKQLIVGNSWWPEVSENVSEAGHVDSLDNFFIHTKHMFISCS